jgi:hypothetical protein
MNHGHDLNGLTGGFCLPRRISARLASAKA